MRRPIEVFMVVAIVGVVGLLILMAIPRQRESARAVRCRDNLRQIGVGLAIDAQNGGHLPAVPSLGALESPATPGPLARLLGDLGRPDLVGLAPSKNMPPPVPGAPPAGRRIAGFLCISDPLAMRGTAASVSYRATAGSGAEGVDGAFAPGRIVTTDQVAAGDGLEYTAAFSERLLGDGRPGGAGGIRNYRGTPDPPGGWRGDAGRSWAEADWRSTLYNHAIPPNAAGSTIALDGRTARMGASSGHGNLVHVLTLDGGVRAVKDGVDPKVWRALAARRRTAENALIRRGTNER